LGFDRGFVANSTGTARMFEDKSYVFCPSSGAGGKTEGRIIRKPTATERETFSQSLDRST